jgi:pimeloyl-ACP methyl ester carboxylesterase
MPYLDTGAGVRLYYEDFGAGPAVVFTSAGQLTHRMWEAQVAGLAGEFRTVTYDWRGTGASDTPRDGYTGDAVAGDLSALVQRLGIGPAVLVGHGIGSHIVMLAAAARPDLVKAMVLVSTAPWFTGERDGVAAGAPAAFLDTMFPRSGPKAERGVPYADLLAEMGADWLYHRPPSAAVLQALLEQGLSWPQFVIGAYAKSMREIDHRQRLGQFACPCLILQGRHDKKQRYEGAEYMARRIKGARLVTLEDSAHMGQEEEINTFNRHLLGFLREVEATKRAA